MGKREQTTAFILEILHPVLLAALAGPICYCVCEDRVSSWIFPMYLLGMWLLPLSAAARTAERKIHNLFVFLAVCAAVFAGTFAAGNAMAERIFALSGAEAAVTRLPLFIYRAQMAACGFWILLSSVQIRLRENRRARARLENDMSWQERSILAQKPGAACLLLFLLAYLDGLFNACPPMCDIAAGSGVLYLVLLLIYRSIDVLRAFILETQSLSNVPVRKITGIRYRFLGALSSALCLIAAAAFLTAGMRTYRDLRKWELKGERIEVSAQEEFGDVPVDFKVYDVEFGLGIAEHSDPPAWLTALEGAAQLVLPIALALFLVRSMVRSVTAAAKDFNEIQEENGDIAVRLDTGSEESRNLRARGESLFARRQPLSEREKVRREYRRAIMKYRGDVPRRSETPSQIEDAAQFPQDFDIKGLHEKYERARYGESG